MSPRPPWAIKGELDGVSGDAGGRVLRKGFFQAFILFLFLISY